LAIIRSTMLKISSGGAGGHDDVVHAVQELRPEVLLQLLAHPDFIRS